MYVNSIYNKNKNITTYTTGYQSKDEERKEAPFKPKVQFTCNYYLGEERYNELVANGSTIHLNRVMHVAIDNDYKSGYRWKVVPVGESTICKIDVTNFDSLDCPRQIKNNDEDISIIRIESYL